MRVHWSHPDVPVHLVGAARAWEQILAELHPEHAWIVEVQLDELPEQKLSCASDSA